MNRLLFAAALTLAAGALAAQSAQILPERFLRSYDPVTVQFDRNQGPQGGGPADGPGPLLTVEGAPAGEYRWIDSRTIQFLPAEPWTPLKTVTVRAGSSTARLATLLTPPVSVSPAPGSREMEPLNRLEFTFDRSLPLEDLRKLVRVEIRPLPGLRDAELVTLTDGDFVLRELETRQGSRTTYRLDLNRPIGYGSAIAVVFRLSSEPGLSDTVARFAYETRAPFALTAMGAGPNRLPVPAGGAQYRDDQAVAAAAGDALSLEFSEPLAPVSLETLKSLVSFDPAVKNLQFRTEGSRIVLQFDAQRQTPYKLSVRYQPLVSATGRVLSPFGPTAMTFFLPKADPYLAWRLNEGIVERFGPQFLPLEGRAIGSIDLRIHAVDPLDRNFWPFPSEPVAVDETVRPPQPGREPAPGTDMVNQIRLLSAPPVSRVAVLPVQETSGRSRFGLELEPHLKEAFGEARPGTYLVGYRTLGESPVRHYVRVTVTDLAFSVVEEEDAVLFAVTSLRTGLPVAGAEIQLQTFSQNRFEPAWTGKTDARGFLRYAHLTRWMQAPSRIVVSSADDVLVINPSRGLPVFSNNHWSRGDGYWLSWLTDSPRTLRHRPEPRAYLLSERPLYKPEETVHFVGWIKDRAEGDLRPYSGPALEVLVRGPDSGREWHFEARPNAFGRFSMDFSDKDLPTGTYQAQLLQKASGTALSQMDFQIQAYRVPTFQVDLSGPDMVPLDRPFEVLMTADYYSGGRLVGQPVRWTVNQYPYSITGPQYQGFLFSTDERFSVSAPFGNVGSGTWEGELDATGAARLTVNPSAEPDGRARRYVVTGVVSGADRQTVTQVKQVVALPPFVLGLKLDRLAPGTKEIVPEVLALDHLEKPLAGVPLTLKVFQRQWHSYLAETDFTTGEAKYATDVVDLPVFEKKLTSAARTVSLPVPVPESGVYVVEISGRDFLGRQVLVRADTFVSGAAAVSWPRKRDQVFEMTPDKNTYSPGDTAKILLKSPYQEARALVVVEAPKANEYRWVDVKGGQATFNVTITPDMAPNLPLAALLVRGRIGTPADLEGLDLYKPASVGASLTLVVNPTSLQANLVLSHEVKALPGGRLKIDLAFSAPDGAPLDGEAVLWLVDKAVLSLGKERRLDPLPEFLPSARSWIRISDLRNLVLGRLPVEEVPGGDGSEEALFLEMLSKTTVRKNFKTVPYFNAGIPLVAGKGSVEISLPDNLTDFAVRAVAVTAPGRFATAKSVVSVRLPVLVQSALPRFLRPGDTTLSGGTGRVAEGKGGPAQTGIKLKGLTTEGTTPDQSTRSFVLDDLKAETLRFPLKAAPTLAPGAEANVELYLRRNSDGASDAFAMDIPIRPDTAEKAMLKTYTVSKAGAHPLDRPPEGIRSGSLVQTFLVSTDARILSLLQGLPYLAGYPYGCLEQRTSKLYPAVLFQSLTNLTGIPGTAFPAPGVWKDYFEYLATCQDEGGLLGLWPGSRGSVFLTAYVVEFLAEAKKARVAVPAAPFNRAVQALALALRSDSSALIGQFADYERVEALTALAAANAFDEAYAKDLLSRAQGMPLYSQARLYTLLAAKRLNQGARSEQLLRGLRSALTLKTVAGKSVFPGISGEWGQFQSVLITENRTAAALAAALKDDAPSQAARSALVDWLLARTGPSGWGNTIDTVSGLRALGALLADTTGLRTVNFTVSLAGKAERRTLTKARIMGFSFRSDEQPVLTVEGAGPAAPLYVMLRSRYLPAALGDTAAASNKGFAVTREWLLVDADNTAASRILVQRTKGLTVPLGTVVEEHVRVVSFEPSAYVAVQIPLAAGFEPLNPALATSGPEAQPQGRNTADPSYSSYGDDQVVLFFDQLPSGTHDFYFRVRADFEGTYTQPPALVERMYEESVYGASDGARVRIVPAP